LQGPELEVGQARNGFEKNESYAAQWRSYAPHFAVELLKASKSLSHSKDCATGPPSFWDPVLITRALSCCNIIKVWSLSHGKRKKQRVTGYMSYQPTLAGNGSAQAAQTHALVVS
jgi:hypothetical protein